jgi:hypothetical protein
MAFVSCAIRRLAAASRRHSARTASCLAVLALTAISISSCTASSVLSPQPRAEVGGQTAQARNTRGLQRLIPSNPFMAGYPGTQFSARSSSAGMPAREVECRQRLRRLGVTWRDLQPINEGGACRIDHPVQVTSLAGNVEMKPAATLSCEMAATFAEWTRNELQPAARWRYFSGVRTINQGSSYSCRRIAGTSRPSQHSRGNALDVMSFTLRNGRDIDVRKPGWFSFRERGLLKNVRAGGCNYFSTVLGPGYNAAHADHFHFDIQDRNGRVACR